MVNNVYFEEIEPDFLDDLKIGDILVNKKQMVEFVILSLKEEFFIQNEISNLIWNGGYKVYRLRKEFAYE